ncbi:MAG: recQ [Bacteroidota bacterium]|nr:recQ [Bacteroidota bacterium]
MRKPRLKIIILRNYLFPMPTIQQAQQILKHKFGYDNFRLEQEHVIECILQRKDCIVLMPTGGGKSLCYQVPALLFEGLTVVVSPLISLMKDQVDALRANGINAAFLNSSLTSEEQTQITRQVYEGKLKLLYVAPERLLQGGDVFLNFLKDCRVALFAIDEAHCISSWGHDFRPEYLQLARLKHLFPDVPVVALTATADKLVRKDVVDKLELKSPQVFISSFNRANITYYVEAKKNLFDKLLVYLAEHKDESGIIYCLSRAGCETLAGDLRNAGFNAIAYHAGLEKTERDRAQEKFIRDEIKIVVATIAFGMGIDKPNVRFVIHADIPKNIEGYYQETGRAGRDGLHSEAILYYSSGDVMKLKKFVFINNNAEQTQILSRKLDQMAKYATLTTCRRKYLLNYFDESAPDNCGSCDVCLSKFDLVDGTVIAQKALSAVFRLKENFGINYTIDFLRGSKAEKIREEHKLLKTYGVGADISKEDWATYFRDLIAKGFLQQTEDEFPKLRLTPKSSDVLQGKTTVQLAKSKVVEEPTRVYGEPAEVNYEKELFSRLKELRKMIADRENVPPYIILSDAGLIELSAYLPQSLSDMKKISGFGDVKVQRYGKEFLEQVLEYCKMKNLASRISLKQPKREKKAKRPIKADAGYSSTYQATLDMHRQGLSTAEIAAQRGMSPQTIANHLAQFVESGDLKASDFVSGEKINQLKNLIDKYGYMSLKTIKENAGDDISYDDIKFVVSEIKGVS